MDFPKNATIPQPLILFDGECNMCSSVVRFLLRNNSKANLNFSSMQSAAGIELLSQLNEKKTSTLDTVILVQDNTVYKYSAAALKISYHLQFPWKLAFVLSVIPAGWRDTVYIYIAKNRYRWFGKRTDCELLEKEYADRFMV